ncbi:MAG: hypothetical protein HC896_13805 [Bacteroidales bacterium]|nr:hypothetical protein [Bacteroidales bacterium]
MAGGDYIKAKQAFNYALSVKPGEILPTQKIAEIDKEISQRNLELEEKRQKELAYQESMSQGDGLLARGNAGEAKDAYQMALSNKPNDKQAIDNIRKIDTQLAQQQREEAEKRSMEEAFSNLMAEANRLLNEGQYQAAKSKATQALALKANDTGAKDLVSRADKLLAGEQQAQAEQKQKEARYNALMTEANNYFNKADYVSAKKAYGDALAIDGTDDYPKKRINQIDDILNKLAEQKTPRQLLCRLPG